MKKTFVIYQSTRSARTTRPSGVTLGLAMAVALMPVQAQDARVGIKGGPSFESADGNFKFSVGGRIHLDAAYYDEDAVPMDDGFLVRRARLSVDGTVYQNWVFRTQYDFAENDVSASDLYLRYSGFANTDLTIGQFKVPMSLEELTSSNNITFMERALPTLFASSRRLGLGVDLIQPNWTFAIAGYGRNVGDDVEGDDPLAVGARLAFAPINTEENLVHLGASGAVEWTDDDRQVRFRQRPESRVDGARLVDTGNIDNVDRVEKYGLELAGVFGPFSLQGEYLRAEAKRDDGLPNVAFDGYYVYGSWLITGESRPYRNGTFRGISPQRPMGAWELGIRYSHLDLNDGLVSGGKMDNVTVGVNWYVNPNVRFMANYVAVATDSRGPRTDDPGIFQLRAQLTF